MPSPAVRMPKNRYEGLKTNPLFFLRKICTISRDKDGNDVEYYNWVAQDEYISAYIPEKDFFQEKGSYSLVIADITVESNEEDTDVTVPIYFSSPSDENIWRYVLNSYIKRKQESIDDFPYMEVLWFLNNRDFTERQILKAIEGYAVEFSTYFFKMLASVAVCLSVQKQNIIRSALQKKGFDYNVYDPSALCQAIQFIFPAKNDIEKLNLFEKFDLIYTNEVTDNIVVDSPSDNPILQILYWFRNDLKAFGDYGKIAPFFHIFSEKIRLNIVRRYFHDIRVQNIAFDVNVLKNFTNKKFARFSRYRYCLESPGDPLPLSSYLLCDSIITIVNSGGRTFQEFNGLLDFAIQQTNIACPKIDFGLHHFMPVCDGGAKINSAFKGFIDYCTLCSFNEENLANKEFLSYVAKSLLESKGKPCYVCSKDNDKSLPAEQVAKCLKLRSILEKNAPTDESEPVRCIESIQDMWVVNPNDKDICLLFEQDKSPKGEYIFSWDDFTPDVFSTNIRKLLEYEFENDENGLYIVPSKLKKELNHSLVRDFFIPIRMRIIPNPSAYIDDRWNYYRWTSGEERARYNTVGDSNIAKEILFNRVVESLKEELHKDDFNGSYFEMNYDKKTLDSIKTIFLFRSSDDSSEEFNSYLKSGYIKNRIFFCAPECAVESDRPSRLPYYWCMGRECFFHVLQNQFLHVQNNWKEYTLFHLLEIIQIPMMEQAANGFQPKSQIRDFIAVVNRVTKLYRRLKCKCCGHLIFSEFSSGFNRYNHFKCVNPVCKEKDNSIYLSYCHECKRGLIDSRDSARCPNGWYICPECLSCCNDQQYQRQADRYIKQHLNVPPRILEYIGKGHNDKGEFFCPKCGAKLLPASDDERGAYIYCPNCHFAKSEYQNQHE